MGAPTAYSKAALDHLDVDLFPKSCRMDCVEYTLLLLVLRLGVILEIAFFEMFHTSCFPLSTLTFLLELLRRIGLRLNPAKSKLLAPETIPEPTATDFADAGIPAAQTSMELLGTAIGDAAGIHEFLDSKELEYGKAIATFDHALAKRFSRQVLFKLHRFCAAARNVHLFRTISPRLTEPFAQRLKTRTTEMFYRNCRGFSDPHREVDGPVEHPMCQALLYAPLHLGGLAMPDPTVLRHSAWVSSVRKTANHVE